MKDTRKLQQQKSLTVGKSLQSNLPNFLVTFCPRLSQALLLASLGTVLTASAGWAVVLTPTSLTVNTLPGTQNTGAGNSKTSGYNDDIVMSQVQFSGVTFSSSGQFRPVLAAEVLSNRSNVNAEFGDRDNGSDGNPNPFVAAGVKLPNGNPIPSNYNWITDPSGVRESTNPGIQDNAIRSAFNTLSVSQGVDGEALGYTFQVVFQEGITDTSTAADQVPELIFFERGANSDFTVRAITGGTFDNPQLSPNTVTVNRNQMLKSSKFIDTVEILSTDAQELGVVGIDLTDFGIYSDADPNNNNVYGVQLSSINNSGADLYGQFVASETQDFEDLPPELAPEPLTILGSGMALGFGALMQRQRSRKLQKAN